jgi:tellurite resistance-related uncharacterized protein
MKKIPESVMAYKRTPVFTNETMPKGLLKDHATSGHVWGRIHMEEGEMEYTIPGEGVYILKPGQEGVIEPQILHHVRPLGKVLFFIEFFK